MSQDENLKIRTLPRKSQKGKSSTAPAESKPATPRWIIYVGTCSGLLLSAVLFLEHTMTSKQGKSAKEVHQTEQASVAASQNQAVTRHLQESYMHHQLLVQAQQIENAKMKTRDLQADSYALDPASNYGVQFDQEDTADRVYEDLNVNSKNFAEITPDEKISAKLANRRWVNELERRERVTFIKNFIKSAYNRGYEVEINENLVVVGVRRVTDTKKFNIDQIVDKLAAKGR